MDSWDMRGDAIYLGFDAILKIAEIPTYIDFGETITVTRGSGRYSYEEEIDGTSTTAGILIMIFSLMIASRIGMAILYKSISGGLNEKSHVEFNAWFLGLSLMLVCACVISRVSANVADDWYFSFMFNITKLAGGIFVIMRKWREHRIHSITNCARPSGLY
jgi:hypothetical protein